jgi:hypothetical protein
MLKYFQHRVMPFSLGLLGCAYLSACDGTRTEQPQPLQTPNQNSPVVTVPPPPVQEDGIDRYAKLSREFLEKIDQVPDPNSRMYYTAGIHELHRMAQRDPKNREILEKLVQHQEQTLEIFQVCGDKEKFTKAFDWVGLYHSLFWKRADDSYLILLICGSGNSNRRFVPFLYWESNGEAQFKPLKLVRFIQENDGTVQRIEPDVGVGRTFPNREQWFDPVTEELRIWTRLGGGAALCGTRGTYQLQGSEFILQKFTAHFDCNTMEKEAYETLYP